MANTTGTTWGAPVRSTVAIRATRAEATRASASSSSIASPPGDADRGSRIHQRPFQLEQGDLLVQAAGVAAEAAARLDHPVTRHHDGDGVGGQRAPGGPHGTWATRPGGDVAVRRHRAVGDAGRLGQHRAVEPVGQSKVDGGAELATPTLEV